MTGRRARLEAFAAAHQLDHRRDDRTTDYPGALFAVGEDRHIVDRLRRREPRLVEVGNLRYTAARLGGPKTITRGYLMVELEGTHPHLFLDSLRNGPLRDVALTGSFSPTQRLSLEGDFGRHFQLYCPADHRMEAHLIFTPDLMAVLIDEATAFDVEIVGDLLFAYAERPFDLGDEAEWQRIERLLAALDPKLSRQTRRDTIPAAGLPLPARARLSTAPGALRTAGIVALSTVCTVAAVVWWVAMRTT